MIYFLSMIHYYFKELNNLFLKHTVFKLNFFLYVNLYRFVSVNVSLGLSCLVDSEAVFYLIYLGFNVVYPCLLYQTAE